MVTLKSSPKITEHDVLAKCDYFLDLQLWPLRMTLDPERWLSNFTSTEHEYAIHLLNSFMFFSVDITNAMFISAFQALSMSVRKPGDSLSMVQSAWRAFCDTALITYVTGEAPNKTDSGLVFARKARPVLGFPEERIVSPDQAARLAEAHSIPVIFVDDFVGSGNQFRDTWHRVTPIAGSLTTTFAKLASVGRSSFYYIPLIATHQGVQNINAMCSDANIRPAHLLPPEYSALSSDSVIWPTTLLPNAEKFVFDASVRAGIPDTGGNVDDWRGFHKLGLTVAFSHGIPDATLPLFYWEENGWKPLVRRT